MANRKNDVFCADNQHEEALMLMGRVNALAGIARISKYSVIDCEIVAAVMGFDLGDVDQEPEARRPCGCTTRE